jgi:hypothetical protein
LVEKLADDRNYTLFGPRHCWVYDKDNPNNVIFTGTRLQRNGLYKFNPSLLGTHEVIGALVNILGVFFGVLFGVLVESSTQ